MARRAPIFVHIEGRTSERRQCVDVIPNTAECRPDAAGLGGQDRVPLRLRERKCSGLFLYRRSDGGHGVELLTCAVPGIGRLLISSVTGRDFPLTQTLVMYIALIIVLTNFAVDLLIQVIDPRIRLAD